MAVTRADVELVKDELAGGFKSNVVMVAATLLALAAFIFSLVAETTRSQVLWEYVEVNDAPVQVRCILTGSSKLPVACAVGAILTAILATGINQIFVGRAILMSHRSSVAVHPEENAAVAEAPVSIKWHSMVLFVVSWTCFLVSCVLLLAGVSVEVGHLKQRLQAQCKMVRQGVFAGGGIFALASASFGVALGLAALQSHYN